MKEGLVAKARDCLRIRLIVLRESRLTMHPDFFPTNPGDWGLQSKIVLKSVFTGSRLEGNNPKPTTFVRGFVEAGVRLISPSSVAPKESEPAKEDGTTVGAELVATFVAEYDVEEGKELSAEAVNEFLKHNAVYHVWSYWREYVQSTFARALLPHITLPMMVVTPTASPAQPPAEPPAQANQA